MKYVPHDYQAYCIQRVVEDPAVGLFLRPGLGKTVITLSAVNILKYFRWQVQKVLVLVLSCGTYTAHEERLASRTLIGGHPFV